MAASLCDWRRALRVALAGVMATTLGITLDLSISESPVAEATNTLVPATRFEIDGNRPRNNPALGDWATPYGPGTTPGGFPTTGIYGQGTSPDGCGTVDSTLPAVNALHLGPNYVGGTNGANGKADLLSVEIAAEKVNVNEQINDILYLGYTSCVGGTGSFTTWIYLPNPNGPDYFVIVALSGAAQGSSGSYVYQGEFDSTPSRTDWTRVTNVGGNIDAALNADFGEVAINLTALGIVPDDACSSINLGNAVTGTLSGNIGSPDSGTPTSSIQDVAAVPPAIISNCAPVTISKTGDAPLAGQNPQFTYLLNQLDGEAVHDSTLSPADGDGSFNSITSTIGIGETDQWNNVIQQPDYFLRETAVPLGWVLENITCEYNNFFVAGRPRQTVVLYNDTNVSDGIPATYNTSVNFDINATTFDGSTYPPASCTITNRTATVIVEKVGSGDPAQDFAFTVTDPANAPGTISTRINGADSPLSLGESSDPISYTPGGVVTITETLPGTTPGWSLDDITCTDAQGAEVLPTAETANSVTVVALGATTITCSFENNQQGRINFEKTGAPDGEGPFGFDHNLDDNSVAPDGTADDTLNIGDPSINSGDLAPGEYMITELLSATNANFDPDFVGTVSCAITSEGSGASTSTTDVTSDSVTAVVTLAAGDTVTCTFTNIQDSRIVVDKETVNGDDTFAFTGAVEGSITTVDGGTPAGDELTADVAPGEYTVTETPTPGYTLTGIDCSGTAADPVVSTADGTATVTTAAGETATCTFTNERNSAQLTLDKSWVDAAAGDVVELAAEGSDPDVGESIDTTATAPDGAVAPNTMTVYSGETVSVEEAFTPDVSANYDVTLVCSDADGNLVDTEGALTGSFIVPDNPTAITCTFENTRKSSTLTVDKQWTNAVVDNAVDISLDGENTATGESVAETPTELDEDVVSITVYAGEQDVAISEAFDPGDASIYDTTLTCGGGTLDYTTGDLSGTLDIAAADTDADEISCVFTNARRTATVQLQKTWVDGAADDTAALTVTGTESGATGSATSTSDGTAGSVTDSDNIASAVVYLGETIDLSEVLSAADNYDADLTCSAGDFTYTDLALSGQLVVPGTAADDTTVTCTFTNTRKRTTLTLQKSWVGAVEGDEVNLAIDATNDAGPVTALAPAADGLSAETASITVFAGETATLSEAIDPNGDNIALYDATAFSCNGGTVDPVWAAGDLSADLIVAAGATESPITCTFTNTAQRGDIIIIKNIAGNDSTFEFTGDWPDPDDDGTLDPNPFEITTTDGSGQITFADVLVPKDGSTYSVTEEDLAPAFGTTVTCTDTVATTGSGPAPAEDGLVGTIGLDANDVVTCVYNNTENGTVVIIKDAIPDQSQDFEFTSDMASGDFTLDDDADDTLSNTYTELNVVPGEYTITETQLDGWTLNSITCVDGNGDGVASTTDVDGATATVNVDPAETVTCTFVNERNSAQFTLAKEWVNAIPGDTVDLSAMGSDDEIGEMIALTSQAPTASSDTMTVYSGETVDVLETFTVGDSDNYVTTLECTYDADGSPAPLTVIDDYSGEVAVGDEPTDITCTFSNERPSTTLTIEKTWVNAISDHAVEITADGVTTVSGTSSADPAADGDPIASETDEDVVTITVFAGDEIDLTEVFTTGDAALYDVSLSCESGNLTYTDGDLSGSLAVTADDVAAPFSCEFTNTRREADLTLQKSWVDAQEGDTAALTITGQAGTSDDPDTGAPVSTAGTSPFTGVDDDPANQATLTVFAGETVDLAEVLSAPDNYTSTVTCDNSTNAATDDGDGTGSLAITAADADADIVCTITNTRVSAELTLQKSWVEAAEGDTAALTITGEAGTSDDPDAGAPTSTAGPSPFTDVDENPANQATLTVYAGETVDLAEVLSNAENYTSTVVCESVTNTAVDDGDGTGSLAIVAADADADILCTITNTRLSTTLQVDKSWIAATPGNTVNLTAAGPDTSGAGNAVADTPTELDEGVISITVYAGTDITLTETFTNGSAADYDVSLSCSADGLEYEDDALSGIVSVAAADTGTDPIVCTWVNGRLSAELVLQKEWVNGQEGDTAALTITGEAGTSDDPDTGAPVSTAGTSPFTAVDDDPANQATLTVYAGETVDLAEVLSNAENYSSTVACSGATNAATDDGDGTGSLLVAEADADSTITCTITNTRLETQLVFEKDWIAGVTGDEVELSVVSESAPNPVVAVAPGGGTDDTPVTSAETVTTTVFAGETLDLSEVIDPNGTNVAAYTPLGIICDGGTYTAADTQSGSLAVAADDTATDPITCTVTNEAQRGTIVIVKAVEGADGTFSFDGDWPDPDDDGALDPNPFDITTDNGSGQAEFIDVLVPKDGSTYSVTEVVPDDQEYDGTLVTCADGDADGANTSSGDTDPSDGLTGTIGLDPDETVVCTFNNTQRGSITIAKVAAPADGTEFEFDIDDRISIADGGDALLADGESFTTVLLPAGDAQGDPYTVTEVLPDGWVLNPDVDPPVDCSASDGSEASADGATSTIDLGPGGLAICTYYNALDGEVSVAKTVTSEAEALGDNQFAVEYTIEVQNAAFFSQMYDLVDSLNPGGDTSVVSTEILSQPAGDPASGTWNGVDDTALATGVTIEASTSVDSPTTHTYVIRVVFDVPTTITVTDRDCTLAEGEDGTGFRNDVTVTVEGQEPATDEACDEIPDPDVSVVKTAVGEPVFNADLTYTVTYDIEVTNSGEGPGQYDLVDVPEGGDGVSVVGTVLTASPDGVTVNDGFNGTDDTTIATGVAIDGAVPPATVTHLYTVEVTFAIDAATVTPEALECQEDGSGVVGGFVNTAEVTVDGETVEDDDCVDVPPGELTIEKSVTTGPTALGGNQFEVVYEIVVTNEFPFGQTYDVIDELSPGANTTVVSAEATTDDGGTILETWTGEADSMLVDDAVIDGRTVDTPSTNTYAVTVVFEVSPAVTVTERDCATGGARGGSGFFNAATVDFGNGADNDFACEDIPDPDVSVVKTAVGDPVVNSDQTYTVTYDIEVINSGEGPGRYDLVDVPEGGEGVMVEGAVLTASPDGVAVNGGFNGTDDTTIATGVAIDGAVPPDTVTHLYTVEVTFSVDPLTVTPEALECQEAGSDTVGGFANTAQVTIDGETVEDDACVDVPPGELTIEKSITTGPTLLGDNQFEVVYEIVVANEFPFGQTYDLIDELVIGDNTTVVSAEATTDDGGAISATWNGVDDTLLVDDAVVAGGSTEARTTHTYVVTVVFDVAPSVTVAERECGPDGGEGGSGFFNRATVEFDGGSESDDVCENIPDPDVSVTKTAVGDPVLNDDLTYTVTYDIEVTNSGEGPGAYDLSDVPEAGAGVTVVGAELTASPDGVAVNDGFNGIDDTTIATAVGIDGAVPPEVTTHLYTVEVTFAVDALDVTPTSLECQEAGSDAVGGFVNTAEVTIDGETIEDNDCVDVPPGALEIDKQVTAGPTKVGDATYEVDYTIDVSNPADGPITYALTDEFAFADGTVVVSVATANTAPGSIETNPEFDGDTDVAIASGVLSPGATHTYTVTVVADVSAVSSVESLDCDTSDSGNTGFRNLAAVNPTAEACVEIPPEADLAIDKVDAVDPIIIASGQPASIEYTLNVVNNGPVDATGVTVTDVLPAGTTFVSATPAVGTCTESGGTVTCDIGDLADGATTSIALVVSVSTTADVTVENTASVTGDQPDPDPSNNDDDETTTIQVSIAPTPVRTLPPTTRPPQPARPLPRTGGDMVLHIARTAGIALAAGAVLLLIVRRRRSSDAAR